MLEILISGEVDRFYHFSDLFCGMFALNFLNFERFWLFLRVSMWGEEHRGEPQLVDDVTPSEASLEVSRGLRAMSPSQSWESSKMELGFHIPGLLIFC